MSRIKDENFYQVQGWMLNKLNLKGIDLQIYAIIYGFSQDGETEFSGGVGYLCDFTGASKPTVIKSLKKLCENEFIIKNENKISGVVFNRYKANLLGVKKFNLASKETLLDTGKEILPNNKLDNNKYKEIKKEINKEKKADELFEKLWEEYPNKKGKADVHKTNKLELLKFGYEKLSRAIKNYDKSVSDKKFLMHGSRFFKTGFLDYLETKEERCYSNIRRL